MIKVYFLKRNKEGFVQGQPVVKELDFDLDDSLTLEHCHIIVTMLHQIQLEPRCIGIDLGNGQFATHNIEDNCLRIWKDDFPIFEDRNGVICEDGATILEYMMR